MYPRPSISEVKASELTTVSRNPLIGCTIKNKDYLVTVFLLITGYNSNPFHRCMDNSPIPQNL